MIEDARSRHTRQDDVSRLLPLAILRRLPDLDMSDIALLERAAGRVEFNKDRGLDPLAHSVVGDHFVGGR